MYSAHLSISASFSKNILSCLSIIPVVWIAFLRFVTPDLFMHLLCSMLFPLFLNIALQASSLWLFCIPVSPVDSSYRKCGCSWLFYIFCAHHIYDIELIQGVKCFSSQLLAKHCLLPWSCVYILLCSSLTVFCPGWLCTIIDNNCSALHTKNPAPVFLECRWSYFSATVAYWMKSDVYVCGRNRFNLIIAIFIQIF